MKSALYIHGRISVVLVVLSLFFTCGAVTIFAASSEYTVVYPREIDEPLHNPLKGWVLIDHAIPGGIDAGRSVTDVKDGTAFEWYQGAAIMSTWAQVEPQPDTYDWSLVDKAVTYWTSEEKEIHLRFSTEDFGNIPGCPRWLFEMGVPCYTRPQVNTMFPDYTHPVYLERLQKFMAEFSDHFCNNPAVETIDLRAYGNWGEWHSGTNYETVFERVRALRQLIDIWRQYNDHRKWLILSVSPEWRTVENSGSPLLPQGTTIHEFFAPTYNDFLYRSVFDYALPFPDIAIRRDGVGGCVDVRYDGRLIATFFEHYRKPLFMEFFGGREVYLGPALTGFEQTQKGDNHIEAAVDEMLSHHPNFCSPMGWLASGGAIDFYNDNFDMVVKGHKSMGYRFVLVRAVYPKALSPGDALTLYHTWENRAMGRCYRQFPLMIYLMKDNTVVWQGKDHEYDQRNYIHGQSYDIISRFELPSDLKPDSYELRLAMVDEQNRPAINLAIPGGDKARRYYLGRLTISSEKQVESECSVQKIEVIKEKKRWVSRQTLEPDHSYLVSFRYQVTSNPEYDLDSHRPDYFRFLVRGKDYVNISEVRWFDKACQPPAFRTCLVNTEANEGCRLFWETIGGGLMRVDDVTVQPLDRSQVIQVSIHSQSKGYILASGAKLARFKPDRIEARRDESQVVLPDDWHDFMMTEPSALPLEPDTVYTVWFDCAMRPQVWVGDYAYVAVRRKSHGREDNIAFFRWTQRHTTNPVNRAFSFRTGPHDDYQLVWGLKNGGCCELENITIIRR